MGQTRRSPRFCHLWCHLVLRCWWIWRHTGHPDCCRLERLYHSTIHTEHQRYWLVSIWWRFRHVLGWSCPVWVLTAGLWHWASRMSEPLKIVMIVSVIKRCNWSKWKVKWKKKALRSERRHLFRWRTHENIIHSTSLHAPRWKHLAPTPSTQPLSLILLPCFQRLAVTRPW